MEPKPIERNLGSQPLDQILTEMALTNHDLVGASVEPLTHKAVQRGRKGRRLTPETRRRITAALNLITRTRGIARETPWAAGELFNYHQNRKTMDTTAVDHDHQDG